jgi:acetamidase/formamidase
MRTVLMALLLAVSTMAQAEESWVVAIDLWGNRSYQTLTLRHDAGGALSGDLDGDRIAGRREGEQLIFTATASDGSVSHYTGRRSGENIAGEADMPDTNTAGRRARHAFTARRVPERPASGPRTHDFAPTDFSNLFSADRAPVLTIWPGDTVRTSTIDSGGVDAAGQTRALYGNPQTGPFFVAGARPGDVLAVRLDRLRTNRDWADSLDMIVGRAQTRAMTARAGDLGRPVRWRIDAARGIAMPETDSPRLRGYSVPLRPMLGGIAVAPGFGFAPPSTGDTGRFGGNIDFNEVIEGNIVYLPVQQPGALLYIGDAHAAQGDGETSQFALETSMDVTFTVDLIRGRDISGPRVESPTHIMAIGQAGTMEDATRLATASLAQWLEQDYGLSLAESALLLGSAVEYRVVTLAGQNIGMAAKLAKARLEELTRTRP